MLTISPAEWARYATDHFLPSGVPDGRTARMFERSVLDGSVVKWLGAGLAVIFNGGGAAVHPTFMQSSACLSLGSSKSSNGWWPSVTVAG